MNIAAFFQKYSENRMVNILKRLYTSVALRSNQKRIQYLRDAGAVIAEGVRIGDIAMLGTEPYLVEIGENTFLTGGETRILTHDGACAMTYRMGLYPEMRDYLGCVKIGANCFVGNKCIIMKNVTIGNNCIIGAGSIVTKSIPDNSVACGVPAKVICTVEEWIDKNKQHFDPTANMNQYEKRLYVMENMEKYEQRRRSMEAR